MIINKQLAESAGHTLSDLWETPWRIIKKLDKEFGFTLDPCCLPHNATAEKYYTPEDNGLVQDWSGEVVYCNPPYSRGNIDKWVKKCYEESQKQNTTVVALLPVSTSSNWWHNWIVGKAEVRFVERRVRFRGAPYTAPFSSVVVVWGGSGVKSFNQGEDDERSVASKADSSTKAD